MENLFIPSSPNIYSHNGSEYKGNKCSALIPLDYTSINFCGAERVQHIKNDLHRRVQRGGSGGPDPPLFLDPPFHL